MITKQNNKREARICPEQNVPIRCNGKCKDCDWKKSNTNKGRKDDEMKKDERYIQSGYIFTHEVAR